MNRGYIIPIILIILLLILAGFFVVIPISNPIIEEPTSHNSTTTQLIIENQEENIKDVEEIEDISTTTQDNFDSVEQEIATSSSKMLE